MQMAESAVSFVVETIGNLLIDEAKFLWGVEGKVKELQKELKQIQRLLRNIDKRREHEQAVGEWIVDLQDIRYEAEDVIERYILRIMPKKDENIIKAYACLMSKCMCIRVHEVGTQIDGLKSRISDLRARLQEYGIMSVNEGEREHVKASAPIRSYAHVEEDLVGREDSINELVKRLLKDGKQDRVISIWGIDGLGKTALARKVYTHDKVKKHFDGYAWECVSREYQVRDILEGIFVKLIPDQKEEVAKMRDDELSNIIYTTQKEKRCIVVLDDIWTTQAWDGLRHTFPINNPRSKLLITTRNREVAEYIDALGFLHQPRCLSNEESWELLKMTAFPEMEEITENMKLGGELLRKCGGLPSAIIVLGRLLAVNEPKMDNRNINSHFSDKISNVLALSYDDLPWPLKQCFLYLCSFSNEEEIPAAKVLHMWIAEGFVLANPYTQEREDAVEDVAEQYLKEFINRGLVQVQFTLGGKIKTCRLHDPMRDLCISKAMQESSLSILNIQQGDEVESICAPRRLSLHMLESAEGNTIPKVNQIGSTMLNLRTLMFFHSVGSVKGMWQEFQPIFINCKFLRVLKLEDLFGMRGNLPESVGDLVHLRYLSLARSVIEGLPQSMGNLVCMEFLDLALYDVVVIPNVLWKMGRLRYLYLPTRFAVHGSKKLQLNSLKHLRTLRNFCPDKCDVNDVGKHTKLRKLTVCKQYGSDKLKIIPQLVKVTLKHLRSSSFRFASPSFTEDDLIRMSSYPHSCKLTIGGKIAKLPEHKTLPQKLRKLVLMDSQLKEDPMPILEKLQDLVVLLLGNMAFVGKEMVCTEGGFAKLKHLVLANLPNLEEWTVAKGAMPHLSRLGISKCFNLRTVPQGAFTYDDSEDIDHELSKYRD